MGKRLSLDTEELTRLYVTERWSCSRIARSLGVSVRPVVLALRKAGVCVPARRGSRELPIAEILRLYWLPGGTVRSVAESLGVGAGGVYRVLTLHGGLRSQSVGMQGRCGAASSRWKGGRRKVPQGYIYVYKPGHPMATKNGYVFEHRLVAAESAGRSLRCSEHVHHINGVKDDNRPENLVVVDGRRHSQMHADHRREVWELRKRVEQLESHLHAGTSLKVFG